MMRALYRSAAACLILGVALLSIPLALKPSDTSTVVASSNTALAQPREAPRWEYKTLAAKSPEALMVQANQNVAESWELVNAVHVTDSNLKWVGIFKRRKQQ
jgi:hypothetical protein